MVVISPDELVDNEPQNQIISSDTVDLLPLTLSKVNRTNNVEALSKALKVLAECNAINWECLTNCAVDVEAVCVSNAVALIEAFDGLKEP